MPRLLLTEEVKKLEAFDADLAWFQKHYKRLKRQFKGEYVAVKSQEVVDHDKDVVQLLQRARKKYGDVSSLVVEHVSERKFEYIL